MTWPQAIHTCFLKYDDFSGRADRPEFEGFLKLFIAGWVFLFLLETTVIMPLIWEAPFFTLAVFVTITGKPLVAVGNTRSRQIGIDRNWEKVWLAKMRFVAFPLLGSLVLLGLTELPLFSGLAFVFAFLMILGAFPLILALLPCIYMTTFNVSDRSTETQK